MAKKQVLGTQIGIDMRFGVALPSGGNVVIPDSGLELQQACGVRLTALQGVDAVSLEVTGLQAVHVEVQQGGQWSLSDFLEPGATGVVGLGSRFFVSSRQSSTTCHVIQLPTSPAAGPSQQRQQHRLAQGPAGGMASTEGSADTSPYARGDRARRYEGLTGSPGAGPSSPKRQRREEPGPGGAGAEAGAGVQAEAGPSSSAAAADPLDGVPDSPFHLMRVRGVPDWANEGFLGLKLGDLVRGQIKFCLISNYMVDFQWLLSACKDLQQAEHIIVVHGESGGVADKIAADVIAAGLQMRTTVHAPPLPIQFGTHHSKAFLVQYERGLRVVVHTANLIYADCNNKSQGVWWQDFPRKDDQSPESSPFQTDLAEYLSQLRLPPSVARAARDIVAQHDFSVARARLVGSVPGYHNGNKLHSWGHMQVRAYLSQEQFPATFAGAPLAAQFSSLGSIDDKWLTGEFSASLSSGRHSGGSRLGPPSAGGPSGLQLVWPTVSEIQNSIEGWMAGRSVPGPDKNVSKPFLQPYWHRWGGEPVGRQRAMPHIKSYARYTTGDSGELAWYMVTSSNLSKAAWGALQKNASQLMVRSYELGVLLLPRLELAYRNSRWVGFSCTSPAAPPPPPAEPIRSVRFVRWQRGASQEASLSESGTLTVPLPVPYSLPPTRYVAGDNPWAVDTLWPGVDSWGCAIASPHGRFYGSKTAPILEEMEWGDV